MADILIRGMEMPKTCCQCDLKIYDNEIRWDENGIEQIGAWVCKRTREIIWNTQRGENCPLVPIPEGHGRLIDADAPIRICGIGDGKGYYPIYDTTPMKMLLNQCVGDLPKTIVPAEGGEEA